MTVEKDDLGLTLSLSSSESRFPLQLTLMPSSPPPFLPHHKTAHWTDLLASSGSGRGEARAPLRGIDVNRAAAAERESGEEEGGASSPNSAVSSVSGKRAEREAASAAAHGGEDLDGERACSRSGASDEEDADGSRKKLRLSKDQSAVLEESFKEHNTLNPKQKLALAKQLNLRPRQVEVWFQNRRARTKLKQTEVDCEFLKRCCENLTEENRRLQKEVAELRALKLSPQFYMHMTPPTTLTMCPSCERVAVPNSAATPTVVPAQPPAAPPPPPADHRHHPQLHLNPRPFHIAPAPAPWAAIPLRAAFLDAPLQRS